MTHQLCRADGVQSTALRPLPNQGNNTPHLVVKGCCAAAQSQLRFRESLGEGPCISPDASDLGAVARRRSWYECRCERGGRLLLAAAPRHWHARPLLHDRKLPVFGLQHDVSLNTACLQLLVITSTRSTALMRPQWWFLRCEDVGRRTQRRC